MLDVFEEVLKLKKEKKPGVLITVIDRKGQGPANVGKKLLVSEVGENLGTVGGGELEYLAIEKARELLEEKSHFIQSYNFTGEPHIKEGKDLNMICGGNVTLYFEYIPVKPTVYIIGGGHVGKCVIALLKNLDYDVVLIDDRKHVLTESEGAPRVLIGEYTEIIKNEKLPKESYIVITAYSHEIDYEIMKAIYTEKWEPKYIGLMASNKKAEAIIAKVGLEAGEVIDWSNLYSPIGLDIGGDTPEEIAISIISEIQAIRYNKSGLKHMSKEW